LLSYLITALPKGRAILRLTGRSTLGYVETRGNIAVETNLV
jgi:hypothetical protein